MLRGESGVNGSREVYDFVKSAIIYRLISRLSLWGRGGFNGFSALRASRAYKCQHHLHLKEKKKRFNILLRFNTPPAPGATQSQLSRI